MRFLGIPVSFHQSFPILAILCFMSSSWITGAQASFEMQIMGGVCLLAILVFSILIHERGHILAAAQYGNHCSKIILMGLGGAAILASPSRKASEEFIVAAAGPLTSVIIALVVRIILIPLALAFELHNPIALNMIAALFGINLVLAIFNCIPMFPMDGGRMLYAALWKFKKDEGSARNLAIRVARMVIIGLLCFSVFQFAQGTLALFGLLWRFILGFLIWNIQKQVR